ncbi:MAG TPA: AMP-binding protein, partial [Gaiellales bacterium]|nr:AMP-binding protein [Gaiellales bacterium]
MTQSIPEFFDAAVSEVPGKVWLRSDDATYTYADAHARILTAAAALRERGLRPGELVLATTRNTPDHLFTWLAVMYAGGIFLPVNPASSAVEVQGLVDQVRPRLVVSDAGVAGLFSGTA